MNTKILGRRGEEIAAEYLTQHGYRIVAKNFRLRSGEIDLIALDRDCLCFVEVKSRTDYETPQESVSFFKQRKLTKLAQAYLQKFHGSMDVRCRFDVIAIEEAENGQTRVELFANAFDAVR